MPSLDDAALTALWAVYDRTGVRPEYLLPVLYLESGFDPTRANAAGAPYYGIAQTGAKQISTMGLTPDQFRALPASEQIARAVSPYFGGVVFRYGPPKSATRAYQANFLPATLPTATTLASVLSPAGSLVYRSNPGLDPMRAGAITVGDLAMVMTHAAESPAVRAAIARAYALRPDERPREPVYGEDFGIPPLALAGLGVLWLFASLRHQGAWTRLRERLPRF